MDSPFQWNQPTRPEHFFGRAALIATLRDDREARKPVLLNGEPRRGKSSLLLRVEATLLEEGWRVARVGARSLVDRPAERFWEALLGPLGLSTPLAAEGALRDQRLALCIDDFDQLWRAPIMAGGGAAGLAALARSGVWLITCCTDMTAVAARRAARAIADASVYPLPPFSDEAGAALLHRGEAHLSPSDQAFVQSVCGGEPFLMQRLAGALWELPSSTPGRRRLAGSRVLAGVDIALASAWRSRPPADRWALRAIALSQIDPGVTPMNVPALNNPVQQALLGLLRQLARAELLLLAEAIDAPLGDELPRARAAAAVLNALSDPEKTAAALSALLRWRPDLALQIQKVAKLARVRLTASADLHRLTASGVLQIDGPTLKIRALVRQWWILEQLSAVARGDATAVQWMYSEGLVPPDAHAVTHLQWRIGRLEGLLSRGARPLIEAAAI